MKYLKTLSFIGLSAFLLSSCIKKENYPDVPVITFNSFTPFCSGSTTDSAYLKINFTDGNGDIGFAAQDASAPPDFYAIELIDSSGKFVPLTSNGDTVFFKYLIPNITPSGKDKSLNGIIQINLESTVWTTNQQLMQLNPPLPGYNFYSIEFKVWIFDRAGNKSNIVTTPPRMLCN